MSDAVPEDWTLRLAAAIANAIREFAPSLAGAPIAMLAVDCHPWHGSLDLAALTAAEVADDAALADPAEMAAWRHYNFSEQLEAWRFVAELGHQMRMGYEAAADHGAVAVEFIRACARAAVQPEVAAALGSLVLATGFRVTVTHPDSGHEFVVGGGQDAEPLCGVQNQEEKPPPPASS